MDNSVKRALSLFFIIDIPPITKPINPNKEMNGDDNGILIIIAEVINFTAINTIKRRVKLAAHFPVAVFDQNWIFMFIPPLLIGK